MFWRRKNKQKQIKVNLETKEVNLNHNKMDEEQKQAFMEAMGVKSAPSSKELEEKEIKEENFEDSKNIYKSRAERRAISEGYTRPVAPIPVQAEDVNKVTRKTKMEQTTIQLNINNLKTDVTIDDLYNTLSEVQDYKSEDYTEETWLPFVSAFTKALNVYQEEEPKVEDILIARDTLIIAKNKLNKK